MTQNHDNITKAKMQVEPAKITRRRKILRRTSYLQTYQPQANGDYSDGDKIRAYQWIIIQP